MEDYCVCCGKIVPEGRMICLKCERAELIRSELERKIEDAYLQVLKKTSVVRPPISVEELLDTLYSQDTMSDDSMSAVVFDDKL